MTMRMRLRTRIFLWAVAGGPPVSFRTRPSLPLNLEAILLCILFMLMSRLERPTNRHELNSEHNTKRE